MEVQGIPYKRRRDGESIKWLRVNIFKVSGENAVRVDISSTIESENDYVFTTTVDQASFLKI